MEKIEAIGQSQELTLPDPGPVFHYLIDFDVFPTDIKRNSTKKFP